MSYLKVKINRYKNFTAKEEKKLLEAREKLEVVVNSPLFKAKVLAFNFLQSTTRGMTNLQIYERVMSGRQIGDVGADDYELDIDVTIYKANNSTVGYTYPSVPRTWINRKFFTIYKIASVCRNLLHEFGHKIGFSHTSYWTPSRIRSVCYGLGTIAEDCVTILEKQGRKGLGYDN